MRALIRLILFSSLSFSAFSSAWGAQVLKIKNNRVLVDLGEENFGAGARFLTINSEGKKKSILRIVQVRGRQAVADIEKGKPSEGETLRALKMTPRDRQANAAKTPEAAEPTERWLQPRAAAFLSYASNVMTITAKRGSASENLNLADTTYGLEGMLDYPFGDVLGVRIQGGYEPFSVKGAATNTYLCSSQASCNVDLKFIGIGGLLTAQYTGSRYRVWVGGGASLLYASSKSSNIYNFDQSTFVYQSLLFAGGLDYFISSSQFLPAQIEYDMYPGGSGVNVSQMRAHLGYGFSF